MTSYFFREDRLFPTLFLQDNVFFIQVSFWQNSIKVTQHRCGSWMCRGGAHRGASTSGVSKRQSFGAFLYVSSKNLCVCSTVYHAHSTWEGMFTGVVCGTNMHAVTVYF